MSLVKDWWTEATLHEDLLHGKIDETLFAADLGYVVRGEGSKIYRDPKSFFQRTYLTTGIKELLKSVILRISNRPNGKAIINLQTPFGGGKTHSLIALYHFFRHNSQILDLPYIRELLAELDLEDIPQPKIAVLIGTALKALGETKSDGTVVKTLWGELIYQIGGKELFSKIEKYDKQLVAPGTKDIADIFNEVGSVVILIDEILSYISLIGSQSQSDQISSTEQVLAFFQVLTIATSNANSASLIITFPQSHLERFGKEAENALNKLNKIFSRLKYNLVPVQGIEIYDVIKKRLFQGFNDQNVCRETVERYWQFYQSHPDELPAKIRQASKRFSYKDLMLRAYPFHPELIEIFYERWGRLLTFQSTRGLLRILALCVVHLYHHKRSGGLVLPSHIDLEAAEIQKEILDVVGSSYKQIIETDISGSNALAKRLDQNLGSEFVNSRISEGLATTIFLYSHPKLDNEGITEPFLRLGVYHPDIYSSLISDVISKLYSKKEGLWYLHRLSAERFLFTDQKNIIGRSINYYERISREKILILIEQNFDLIIGNEKVFKTYKYPKTPDDVSDTRQRIHHKSHLSLCILSFDQSFDTSPSTAIHRQIEEIFNFKGRSKTPRDFRNTLIFVVPSTTGYSLVEATAREILAYKMLLDIEKDKLSVLELKQLQHWLKENQIQLPQVILSAYRFILAGGKDGKLDIWDLGPHVYDVKLQLTERVVQFLLTQEKLLKKLDPHLLVSKRWNLWSDFQQPIKTLDLWTMFARYTFLPILYSKEVLENALYRGVGQGLFIIGERNEAQEGFETIYHPNLDEKPLLFTEKTWLIHNSAIVEIKCPKCLNWVKFTPFIEFCCSFCSEPPKSPLESSKNNFSPGKMVLSPSESEKMVERIYEVNLETLISKKDWQNFLRGVLNPLIAEGDQIEFHIKVTSHKGFKDNTLDLAVKETLSQLNLKFNLKLKK